jgi:hypothetical protein
VRAYIPSHGTCGEGLPTVPAFIPSGLQAFPRYLRSFLRASRPSLPATPSSTLCAHRGGRNFTPSSPKPSTFCLQLSLHYSTFNLRGTFTPRESTKKKAKLRSKRYEKQRPSTRNLQALEGLAFSRVSLGFLAVERVLPSSAKGKPSARTKACNQPPARRRKKWTCSSVG